MVRLADTFPIGDIDFKDPEQMLKLIERIYFDLADAINSKPDLYQRTTDGQTTDTFLAQGSININTSTLKVEMLTAHPSATTVTWTQLS